MRRACMFILLVTGFAAIARGQATPPALVNYQGVLRNAADAPQNGTFDMVFRLLDADAGGNEILVDSHLAAGTGGVVVTGGLFNTQVGGGATADGTGPGVYASTAEVFRDHGSVYLEVQVGAEVLSPRIRVAAAPYALNADHLDGRSSAELAILGAANTFTVGPQTIRTGAPGNNGLVIRGSAGQLGTFWEARDDGGAPLAWLDATGGLHAQELLANSFTGDGSGLTNVSASTLDGLDSSQFLRSDASDTFSSGILSFADTTRVLLDDGAVGAPAIAFGPDPSTGLYMTPGGNLAMASIGGKTFEIYSTGDLVIGRRLYPGDQATEFLNWDSALGNFVFTDDLSLQGALRTGTTLPPAGAWNHLGGTGSAPSSGAMNGAGDLFLENDLEVNGVAFLNGELRIDDNGPDGNQFVYFYSGTPTGESLGWKAAAGQFELTDDLAVAGALDLGPGASDDLTAADVTTLTGGGNADALHTHADVGNADTLDGLDSTAFAKLGTANTFTTGVQMVQTGAAGNQGLVVRGAAAQTANLQEWQNSGSVVRASIGSAGTLTLNTGGGPDAVVTEDGIDRSNGASDATFTIQNSGGAGKMTLEVDGVIRAGDPLLDPTSYGYNRIALGVTAPPSGAAMSLRNDLFVEGDLASNAQVYAGTRVIAESVIVVGDTTPSTSLAYSSFGTSIPDEAFITGANDVFITGDLEIDGQLSTGTIKGAGLTVVLAADSSIRSMIDNDNNSTVEFAEWYHDGSFVNTEKLAELQEDGDLRIRGTLSQSVVFDLAEAFLEAEPVEAGDLVRVDAARKDAVRLSRGEGDAAVLGIVSERPGFLLGGAPFDVESLGSTWGKDVLARFLSEQDALESDALASHHDLRTEMEALVQLADVPGEASPILARRMELAQRLEAAAIEIFHERHFAPVALAGRVPVKVDAGFGEIRPGDLLVPSPVPGVAMKATKPGPVIGTALESFSGGRGKILAFVHRGTHTPAVDEDRIRATTESLRDAIETRTPDPETGTQTLTGNLQIVLDHGGDDRARLSVFENGQGSLGAEIFRVDEDGNVFAKGSFRPASLDLAEYHPVTEPVEAGDVLVVDRNNPGKLRKGNAASDPAVVGIVSAEPGVLMGSGISRIAAADPDLAAKLDDARVRGDRVEEAALWKELSTKFSRTHAAIALAGTVPCKVDAGFGAIRVGDLLAVAPTPGHAMRSSDQLAGTILGKALEPLASGTGLIRVLVMLR